MLALVQPGLDLTPQPVPALRQAYEQSDLAALGITYPRALTIPQVSQALTMHARAIERSRSTQWVRR